MQILFSIAVVLGGLSVLVGGIGLYIGLTANNPEWFAIPLALALLVGGVALLRWSRKQLNKQLKVESKNVQIQDGWLARNAWFGPTFLLSLIVIPVVLLFMFAERTSVTKSLTHPEALTRCQLAIQRTARDPETAKVPYVENKGKGTEFYYAWGRETKFARMRNGLGLEVPVSASCVIDGTAKQITALTVDGKTIIGP